MLAHTGIRIRNVYKIECYSRHQDSSIAHIIIPQRYLLIHYKCIYFYLSRALLRCARRPATATYGERRSNERKRGWTGCSWKRKSWGSIALFSLFFRRRPFSLPRPNKCSWSTKLRTMNVENEKQRIGNYMGAIFIALFSFPSCASSFVNKFKIVNCLRWHLRECVKGGTEMWWSRSDVIVFDMLSDMARLGARTHSTNHVRLNGILSQIIYLHLAARRSLRNATENK